MSRGRPRHLLLIAFSFPPSRTSGTYRPLALANYLVRRGWDVTVLAPTSESIERYFGSVDGSLLKAIDPRVHVVRVPMPLDGRQAPLRDHRWFQGNFPALHVRVQDRATARPFRDRVMSWVPGVVRAGIRAHRRKRVDVVLATGNPWSSFLAAYLLCKAIRRPYVMDYRDSWTLEEFSGERAFPLGSAEDVWERRMQAGAALLTFVNEAQRAWHAGQNPAVADRTRVVENGWDHELLGEPTYQPPPPDRPLRFGYLGTVTDLQPHLETWQGWEAAREHPALADATATVRGHLGFFRSSVNRVYSLIPDGVAGISYGGPVGKTEVRSVYDSFDVVLLIVASSPYVTSGKVYECMATAKPIVAIHTPETAASEPMAGYPLAHRIDVVEPAAIAKALVAAAETARSYTFEDFQAAKAYAERMTRSAQFEALVDELEGLTGG